MKITENIEVTVNGLKITGILRSFPATETHPQEHIFDVLKVIDTEGLEYDVHNIMDLGDIDHFTIYIYDEILEAAMKQVYEKKE